MTSRILFFLDWFFQKKSLIVNCSNNYISPYAERNYLYLTKSLKYFSIVYLKGYKRIHYKEKKNHD